MEKRCCTCKKLKALSEFYKESLGIHGRQGRCKMCCKRDQIQRNKRLRNNMMPISALTKLNVPISRVFRDRLDTLESVVVIGYDSNGKDYIYTSITDDNDIVQLLDRLRLKLLEG